MFRRASQAVRTCGSKGLTRGPRHLVLLLVKGVEKLVLSKMLCEGSCRRIHNVDRHAGLVRHAAPALCVCVT